MPQGEMDNLDFEKPLEILLINMILFVMVLNCPLVLLRNHIPELMYKLFSIAGYSKKQVDEKFSGMINALSYGAPPSWWYCPRN